MVVLGELLASVTLKTVFGKLINLTFNATWNEIASQLKFSEDFKSIIDNQSFIQSFLKDAESQPSKLESVRHTLKKLKAAAYDLEDMLLLFESWTTTHKGEGLRKAKKELLACFERLKMPHKVGKMRKTIEEISNNQNQFKFIGSTSTDDKAMIIKNWETTSSLACEVPVGRIDEKERIINLLLADEERFVVSIYGIGGVGKTTLAKMVYNDHRTRDFFDNNQAWVFVSIQFDMVSIGQSIIEQLDNTSAHTGSRLESIEKHLRATIKLKRFLIVLDNLWEESAFVVEKIRELLQGGKAGSKIIITTRHERVARSMNLTGNSPEGVSEKESVAVRLGPLPDDYCWELFRAKARPGANTYMESVGRQIVEKCKGIPLAVQSLGFLCGVPTNNNINVWVKIRDSDIWAEKRDHEPLKEIEVLPSLKLSYHYMPHYLKPCFAYCAIFPKGCHIEKNILIQQWIALGFIQPTEESCTVQDYGEMYFKELLEMSFLQDVAGMDTSTVRCTRQFVLK